MQAVFQEIVLQFALSGLVAALVAIPVCAAFRRLRTQCRALNALNWTLAAPFLLVALTVGGTKTNGVNNLPQQQLMMPRPTLQTLNTLPPAGGAVNLADPVQASRAAAFAADWNVCGAWKDSFWLPFADGWVFPWGTNHLSGVEVVSHGRLWPTPSDTNAVASAGAPFEIVPDLTSFSYELTPSNTYSFAWSNAAIGRDTNDLVSAVLELFRNGDRSVTTNGVTAYLPRELPFAHDGFGQDAEWVAANFTNATEIAAAGGYAAWVDAQVGTDLTNGLYKLTVTVPDDPPETTQIVVGDLSVAVTNAGEYVFLLGKGILYPFSASADCATNFSFVAEDDIALTRLLGAGPVLRTGSSDEGRWIIDDTYVFLPPNYRYCLYEPALEVVPDRWEPSVFSPEKTFTAVIHDIPWFAPSPIYQWTSCGGADVAIANPDQPITSMACPFPASHGSDVDLRLTALVGSVPLQADFHSSTESYNVGDYDSMTPVNGATPALVMESYPSVVFFEKGQPNFETSDVACRYRTASAGTFTLMLSGDACSVVDMENNVVSSGYTWRVEDACSGVRHFTAASTMKSSSPDGTAFAVTFTPDEGDNALSGAAGVVFVEWETETRATWPSDRRRKTIGVCEEVNITVNPKLSSLNLTTASSSASLLTRGNGRWKYTAPEHQTRDTIFASGFGSLCRFNVVAPSGYEAQLKTIEVSANNEPGVAGGYALNFDLTVLPTNVSFYAIKIREVGRTSANPTGYFAEPQNLQYLAHSAAAGADVWVPVYKGNKCVDRAQMSELSSPWGAGGSMTWPIPNEYARLQGNSEGTYFCNTDQSFFVDTDGTSRLEKFGWFAEVTTNRVFNYGRTASP